MQPTPYHSSSHPLLASSIILVCKLVSVVMFTDMLLILTATDIEELLQTMHYVALVGGHVGGWYELLIFSTESHYF